jgi:putative oxidoreductase
MDSEQRLRVSLLTLRASVFLVMFMWTIDKLLNPEHAAGVFEGFYGIGGLGAGAMAAIGIAELLLLLGFIVGYEKTWTYGAVLVLHGISTLSSFRQYLSPFEGPNLLFFAAWPMLAAALALFLLRDEDRLWSLPAR